LRRPAAERETKGHAGRNAAWRVLRAISVLALLPAAGCIVPQPRGDGKLARIVEPTTKRPYWLYLPVEYVSADEPTRTAKRWPLVVTFHGMKPYDIALYQAMEWEQEADRYGFIVVAPELTAFDFVFGEFPLHSINRAFKSDELTTLAILDHIFETTHADPSRVLSTSWSCGGYMAHYMLNRHPERFTCLVARQSDFSASVLDAPGTARSIRHPVLILSTELDIPICKQESREAITWYESHGYKKLAWVYLNKLGHERTPDMAADFFARVCGAQPARPPEVLFQRQAIDGNASGLALLAGDMNRLQEEAESSSPAEASANAAARQATLTQRRPVLLATTAGAKGAGTEAGRAPEAQRTGPPTPKRGVQPDAPVPASTPIGISVSSAIGFAPLLLVYGAECPTDWYRTADFTWLLNGTKIGRGVNGQKTIVEPGDYTLELAVVTDKGVEHRATRQIRVLKNVEAAHAP